MYVHTEDDMYYMCMGVLCEVSVCVTCILEMICMYMSTSVFYVVCIYVLLCVRVYFMWYVSMYYVHTPNDRYEFMRLHIGYIYDSFFSFLTNIEAANMGMFTYIQACMRTYIYTIQSNPYIHIYVYACMHLYIHTYRSCIHAFMHS